MWREEYIHFVRLLNKNEASAMGDVCGEPLNSSCMSGWRRCCVFRCRVIRHDRNRIHRWGRRYNRPTPTLLLRLEVGVDPIPLVDPASAMWKVLLAERIEQNLSQEMLVEKVVLPLQTVWVVSRYRGLWALPCQGGDSCPTCSWGNRSKE